jgi:multicomponent K+:H+ antiporter subunit F
MTALVLPWVIGALALAMLLCLWRLLRGPALVDRALALDTLYINAMAILIALGIALENAVFFEAALIIALLGFTGTVVLARYLDRGRVVD